MISRILFTLALCTSLSACISVLPDPIPASSVYRLGTNAQAAEKAPTAEIIRVDRPSATQIFNSTDIIVTQGGQKLSAVAMAKWSEATPVVIQEAMIEALESSPQFIALVPTSGARTKTRLHLSVKNFEANFDQGQEAAPLAVVQYRVTYARADDRKLLGTHIVRKTARADSINVSSIVTALERANDAAMADIVTWLESRKGRGQS